MPGINIESVYWAVPMTLFLGAMGLPLPENPTLIFGGYAIFREMSPPVFHILIWYAAIMCGDSILFAASYWFFTRPALARFLKRYVGKRRFEAYQKAFDAKGGLTLFLARFAFGIRSVAYVAAGAAHYSWKKFFLIDGLSVALQVGLFVGLGYFAGEKIEWALEAGEKIILMLAILALASILSTWVSTYLIRKYSGRSVSTNTRRMEK